METPTTTTSEKVTRSRRLQGVVSSTSMDKTISVRVERLFPHKRLKRVMRRSRKYLVHDENGTAGVGDTVNFEETRPMSKRKRWTLVEVINKAPEAAVEEDTDANTTNLDANATNENSAAHT